MIAVDHLVIAAETLADGAEWVGDRLGVAPEAGGAHPLMGTHNRLLSLGPDCYLEVIAVDPAAHPPGRPRWFGLDRFSGPPRLVAWVARKAGPSAIPGASVSDQSRGDLRWRITIPDDGLPMAGGAWPMLIDWLDSPHPATRLRDRNLRLSRLIVGAADWPGWAETADPRLRRDPSGPPLRALLDTQKGEVML